MSDRLIRWATIEGASSADPPACAALVMLTSATNRAATAPTDAANGGSCRARADRINDADAVRHHGLGRRQRRERPCARRRSRERERDQGGRDHASRVKLRHPDLERRGGRRQRHHGERAEQRPRRRRPLRVLRDEEQEELARQREIDAVAEAEGLPRDGRACACARRVGPCVAAEHDERQADEHQQRRENPDGRRGTVPPYSQHDPREHGARHRQQRHGAGGALDEETRVDDRQQQREAP